jgi:hypothetical protein
MSTLDRRELQRLRYWQGQILRSQDFRDQVAIEAQLRWWHNRALHNAFGIAGGLAVELLEKSGNCLALVHRGLAYDFFGRELVHPRAESIAVPLAEEGMVLLARYKDSGSFLRKDELSGACLPGIDGLCKEQVELIWKPAVRLDIQDGVPLARVSSAALRSLPQNVKSLEFLKGKFCFDDARNRLFFLGVMSSPERDALRKASDNRLFRRAVQHLFQLSQASPTRQLSRPLARPHIGSGATIAGQTGWEAWMIPISVGTGPGDAGKQLQIGFQVKVDTLAAGFTQVPRYFAWLEGQLWNPSASDAIFGVHWDHIEDVSITSFCFRFVILPQKLLQDLMRGRLQDQVPALRQDFLRFLRDNNFSVSWLGIQPGPGDHHASDADEVSCGHS